jgi:farnesyl-diphosphate farnesyltransferase
MQRVVAEVSRSFALSLRLLPAALRGPTSLAYLLARASDTLADTPAASPPRRIEWLDGLAAEVAGHDLPGGATGWRAAALAALANHPHAGERELLGRLDECLHWLATLPEREKAAIRRVIATIVSGQRLDLVRFGAAAAAHPVGLTPAELDDYTFRVAGCVGRFWTELALGAFGDRFARLDGAQMTTLGIENGKALQLVNIVRDLPADLALGRCYLPVANPLDRTQIMAAHLEWTTRAKTAVQAGFRYAGAMRSRRLRAASILPALLADETLDLLLGIQWIDLEHRPKVPRQRVYRLLWRACWWRAGGQQ